MTKGERTRARIVHEAARLFNTKGYAATSIGDVLEATALEKGGLYRHFSSKEELTLAAFEHAVQTVSTHHRAEREGAASAVAALRAAIGAFENMSERGRIPGGCPLFNAAVEAHDAQPALRGRARRALQAMRSGYADIVARGIAAAEFRRDVDPDAVATILVAALEGALVLSRIDREPRHLRAVRAHLTSYVESLRA